MGTIFPPPVGGYESYASQKNVPSQALKSGPAHIFLQKRFFFW